MIHTSHSDSPPAGHGLACTHAPCGHGFGAGQDAGALPEHAAALADAGGPRSFFFGVMGTPFQSELSTTLLRMVQSALDLEHQVTVWTCGYATNLTQHSLVRPKDSFAAQDAPATNDLTTAQVVQALLHKHSGDLDWYVCRYCMEERGATQQIPEVQIKIPFTFQHYLSAADVSLVLGVK